LAQRKKKGYSTSPIGKDKIPMADECDGAVSGSIDKKREVDNQVI
jgi:hypothetical protein